MTVAVEKYVRSQPPIMEESQIRYLQDELRKLEKVLETVYLALADIEARLQAHSI